MRQAFVAVVLLLATQLPPRAQSAECRFLCTPEFKAEPTITFTPLFNAPRIVVTMVYH